MMKLRTGADQHRRTAADLAIVATLAREGLDVYEGSVAVVARFPKGSLSATNSIQIAVTVQACTNQICLPPSTLAISAAAGGK